jgi:transcriptional regulator with XRE-family HTH domain
MEESCFSYNEVSGQLFTEDNVSLNKKENSGDTIHRALSVYELGRKLRQLRLKKKIALTDLGKHTGLSPSMLSQLENGKMVPTLQTLVRIAMVFDVGLEYFFSSRRAQRLFAVVRAGERMRFPERPDVPNPSYYFECLAFAAQDKGFQAYLAEFPYQEAGRGTEHFHEGSEFLVLLEGTLRIHFQGEDYEFQPGDSVYFDASEPHSYRGSSPQPARALVVTLPPRL